MRIVLLGPPGSGKGTQAVLISKAKKIPHISTGDMMRAAVASGSELGLRIKGYLDGGQLVPDEVVIDLIRQRLTQQDCQVGFLLDGFPRTLEQGRKLDELLKGTSQPLSHVINLSVPSEVLIDRIQKRGAEGSGRSDDDKEIAAKRLQVFWEQTAPLIGFYREQPVGVKELDGLGSIEEVQKRIEAVLNK